jgi:protein-disulfide isomerase
MISQIVLAALVSGVAVFAQGLVEGHPGSPVKAVIYEDLACPDCANFRIMLDKQILPKYGDKVEFVHKDFPLAKHPWSRNAAIAARFFFEKSPQLGLEYRKWCLANIARTKVETFNDRLSEFATAHGIKPEEAIAAQSDKRLADLVEKDFQEAVARGLIHTPTVLVNGAPFIEHFTFEEISKGIDDALAQEK